jgi:Undecaprenyl-phosphate galactose phosphotransferase WbaP
MSVQRLRKRNSARTFAFLLFLSDLFSVLVSFVLAFEIRKHIFFFPPLAHGIENYYRLLPLALVWPLLFLRDGLYPGFWLPRREELRRTVSGSALAGLVLMSGTFLTQTGLEFSRPIIVGGWLIALIAIPGMRFIIRRLVSRRGWQGPAAIVLGAGDSARAFIDGLNRQNPPALTIEAIFDPEPDKAGPVMNGVPVLGTVDQAQPWGLAHGIDTLVIAIPGFSPEQTASLVEEQSKFFQTVILIPDLEGISPSFTDVIDVQGVLVLRLRRNLTLRWNRIVKRILDLFLLLIFSIIFLPLAGLISLAILIETGPPVFFRHDRIGLGGKSFSLWKFRTMVEVPAQEFADQLALHPEFREEWQAHHKLRMDPRLTLTGRLLRRLSLDELPQLWNVLRGDMSFIGPRPIIDEEIPKYGKEFNVYVQVRPGLTGLWQVSGRSNLPYEDRVWLDTHYVRNWSIWLDIVILIRTVWVVIAGIGAY